MFLSCFGESAPGRFNNGVRVSSLAHTSNVAKQKRDVSSANVQTGVPHVETVSRNAMRVRVNFQQVPVSHHRQNISAELMLTPRTSSYVTMVHHISHGQANNLRVTAINCTHRRAKP